MCARQFRSAIGLGPDRVWKAAHRCLVAPRISRFSRRSHTPHAGRWLDAAEIPPVRPGLDIVLTHVDDRFDTGMKDSIGADAARVLPLLDTHSFSFLIEDPATVWNLGPQRYPEIAKRYPPLTHTPDKLAIDINIVDRYQDVYPTKQQTGTELFELVHLAATAFPRVALYFENSILKPDLDMLAASSAVVTQYSKAQGGRICIESPRDLEINWPADGARWSMAKPGRRNRRQRSISGDLTGSNRPLSATGSH